MSKIPIITSQISSASNYSEVYFQLRRKRIVTVTETIDGKLICMLSDAMLMHFEPANLEFNNKSTVKQTYQNYKSLQSPKNLIEMRPESGILLENPWSSLISLEIISANIKINFPCVICLQDATVMYLHCSSYDIFTAQPRDIIVSVQKLGTPPQLISCNLDERIFLGTSDRQIQVMATSKRNELLAFSPFTPQCKVFTVENSILFSKRYGNVFFYLDRINDPSLNKLQFGASREEYVIVKCIIDNREITETRLCMVGFETELVSMDIDNNDHLIFLTSDNQLNSMRGQNLTSKRLETSLELLRVRFNASSQLIFVQGVQNSIFVLDSSMHQLPIVHKGRADDKFVFPRDALLANQQQLMIVSQGVVLVFQKNVLMLNIESPLSLIKFHLNSNKLNWAVAILEEQNSEQMLMEGFTAIIDYIVQHPTKENIKEAETLWTRFSGSKISERYATDLLVRIGYKLLSMRQFEMAFLLARKVKSLRLLGDIGFSAEEAGFHGISLLAKYEREKQDENYINIRQELENIITATGKSMTTTDYSNLLSDFEEVLSITRISETLQKEGYLLEKNFWDIDLEEYAQALLLEGEGQFAEALQLYQQNQLTLDEQRVKALMEQNNRPLLPTETPINMHPIQQQQLQHFQQGCLIRNKLLFNLNYAYTAQLYDIVQVGLVQIQEIAILQG